MNILQLISMVAVAGGILLATLGYSRLARESQGPLAEIADEGFVDFDAQPLVPLRYRLFGPVTEAFGRLGRRLTPSSQLEQMRRHATLAGVGAQGVESVLASKAIATAIGATLVPLAMAGLGVKAGSVVMFAIIGGGVGFLLPGFLVSRKGKQRQALIRKDLPETIDLMAISVQAGMGLEAAIELASQSLPGPLGDELHRLLQEIQLGSSRRQALHQLRDRTDVSELSSFALAMIQADAIGSPIGDVLQSNSARMRLIRRQNAREKAAKLPVKLLIPMMLFIFPALFVVIIGPAGLSIAEKLGSP
ncbi:MAG TPA: type II secretion system F family protein [Actinomycetota bacterium]|nr:type II secretion system F family protein [Actinomycetota bacterium]